MQLFDTLADSLMYVNKEDWNNLIFLYVEIIKEHFMNNMPLSKDIKVLHVIDQKEMFANILSCVSLNEEQTFAKYVKGINLTIEQRAQLLDTIIDKVNIGYNELMAPLAYYQYNDKDAYEKLKNHVDPIIPILKK